VDICQAREDPGQTRLAMRLLAPVQVDRGPEEVKSIAWLVKRHREEPYFGAVIAHKDGSGELFGWYALYADNLTPSSGGVPSEVLPLRLGLHRLRQLHEPAGRGYLPDPAPEVLERIRGAGTGEADD